MIFSQPESDVFVPEGLPPREALARVTHLAIGAHADDLEIMAHSAIAECLNHKDTKGFGGVVVTDGAGSSRTGPYAGKTDEEMKVIRREEQREAAKLGQYAIQIQLGHPSSAVKSSPAAIEVLRDLESIFSIASPEVVYLHNPADKHDTHVGSLLRCLKVIRAMPEERRPLRVLGVEVWRGLDWMVSTDKVALDDQAAPELREQLLAAFDSQITGGKRYDKAVEGRRAANATFNDAHASDVTERLTWAMDLTPLVSDPSLDVVGYTTAYLERLKADVADRLQRMD